MRITTYCKGVILFLLLHTCLIANSQTFEIAGSAPAVEDGSIAILVYFANELNSNKTDTTIIKKGKFVFSGKLIGACGAYIAIEEQVSKKKYDRYIIIEPGNINVSINQVSNKIEVTGSASQREYELLEKELSYETAELAKLSTARNVVDSLFTNAIIDDSTAKNLLSDIGKKLNVLFKSDLEKRIAHVKSNPNSYVSFFSLHYFIGRMPTDNLDALYESLSNKIKGGNADKEFLKGYSKYRKAIAAEYPFDKLQLQETAPAFAIYNNTNKDSLGLKNFAGKILVLELWAITCVPCLYNNLALEKIRKKYNDDEIQIISLAKTFPGDFPAIRNYITKNKFTKWIHVVLNNDANENLESLLLGNFSNYIGLGIPKTIVIDQNGKIAYKSDDYSETQVAALEKVIDGLVTKTNANAKVLIK